MQIIHTDKAPKAVGPYSQGIVSGSFLFTAGQIGIDPVTSELRSGIQAQINQVLSNLEAVLTAAGTNKTRVVKTTIFLQNMDDYATVNQLYGDFFGSHKPARSTLEVAKLPKGALVEIELVAVI